MYEYLFVYNVSRAEVFSAKLFLTFKPCMTWPINNTSMHENTHAPRDKAKPIRFDILDLPEKTYTCSVGSYCSCSYRQTQPAKAHAHVAGKVKVKSVTHYNDVTRMC